jgi:hypothetical protein
LLKKLGTEFFALVAEFMLGSAPSVHHQPLIFRLERSLNQTRRRCETVGEIRMKINGPWKCPDGAVEIKEIALQPGILELRRLGILAADALFGLVRH